MIESSVQYNNNKIVEANNTFRNLETYGSLVSNCQSFIWAILLTLNLFKIDMSDNVTYPMHIFWVEENIRNYKILIKENKYKEFMKSLKKLVSPILKNTNFDIKFLIKNKLIKIPADYREDNEVYYRWRCAFNKLLLFDKENQFEDYKSILMLDTDIMFVKSMKHLFKTGDNMNIDFIISTVRNKKGKLVLNGGISLIKPNKTIFDQILEIQKTNIHSNNAGIWDELYSISEQTFYEYLFFGSSRKRNHTLKNVSNVQLLDTIYNEIVYECDVIKDDYGDVIAWHFAMGPKPWDLISYHTESHETKIMNDHWFIEQHKEQYWNQTYDDDSYSNMTHKHCKYVLLEKWNREWYNKYYKKLRRIEKKCQRIKNLFELL